MDTSTPRPRASAPTLLIREAGSSPTAVAALMGVSVQAVAHYLSGRRRAPADLEDALVACVGEEGAKAVLDTIPVSATRGGVAILCLLDAGVSLADLAGELGVTRSVIRLYLDGVRPVPEALPDALRRLTNASTAFAVLAAIPGFRSQDIAA